MPARDDTRQSIYVTNVLLPNHGDTRVTTYIEDVVGDRPTVALVVKEADKEYPDSMNDYEGAHAFAYLVPEQIDELVIQLLSAKAKL